MIVIIINYYIAKLIIIIKLLLKIYFKILIMA